MLRLFLWLLRKFLYLQKNFNLILEICKHYQSNNYLLDPIGESHLKLDYFHKNVICVVFDVLRTFIYRVGIKALDKNLLTLESLFHYENVGLKGGRK